MAKSVVLPNKKSTGNADRPPKEIASTSPLLMRQRMKIPVLLGLLGIMFLKQDTAIIYKYRRVVDMGDKDSKVGTPYSTDNNNGNVDVVVAPAAAAAAAAAPDPAVGNHNNSSSQNKQNEPLSRGSLGSVSASTTFRLRSSEWLKDIDTESALGCGLLKCAFPSRTSARNDDCTTTNSSSWSSDPDRDCYGYLVSTIMDFDNAKRAFALAQQLSETFGVKHTLLATPLAFGIGEEETNTSIVVQPIKLYPKDAFLFKCAQSRHKYQELVERAKTFQIHSALVDPIVFKKRLQSDYNKTTAMMMDYNNCSRCLIKDFQLAIDPITGSIIHIDIDRCFQTFPNRSWNTTNITDCMQEVETITKSMISRKQYLSSLTIDRAGGSKHHLNKTADHQSKTVAMTKIKSTKKGKQQKGARKQRITKHMIRDITHMIEMARNHGN